MTRQSWHWLGLLTVMGLLGALLTAPVAQAQGDIEAVRAAVQGWLLQTLGKPGLILVEYTYSYNVWPDSSLGCPVPGQPITPGEVAGYRWTFTFDNMVRYEVHSGVTGTPAVLCSATGIAPDVRMTTYNGRDFSVLVPDAWLVFPGATEDETLFAPGAGTDCALPGMLITVLGRVAAGVTPDHLLDEYLAGFSSLNVSGERRIVGTSGRSTTYEAPCNGTTRGWRVTAFVQLGRAYRILQWAPAAEFPQWDLRFENMLSQFTPGGATALAAAPDETAAPTLPALPLALYFTGDVFLGALNDLPGRGVTSVPTFDRRYLNFSPNGQYLSYLDVTNAEVRTMDALSGLSPRRVAQKVDTRFPPAWSADSARLAYVAAADSPDSALLTIAAVPALGGEAERLANFPFAGECSSAQADPAADVSAAEAAPGTGAGVLAWLPDGRFLVSTYCAGGLALLDPATGDLQKLDDEFQGGVVAPDGARVAAWAADRLAVIDLTSGARYDWPVDGAVQQVAWAADGTALYVGTGTLAETQTLDNAADQADGEAVFGRWPVQVHINDLALLRLDPVTGEQALLWRGQGYAIGRIAPAPDGNGVLFSVVPGSQGLVDAWRAGGDALTLRAAYPQAALYWLPTGALTATLLAYAGQPAFAPVTLPVTAP